MLLKKATSNDNREFSRRFLSKKNRWPKAFIKQLSIGKAVIVPLKFSKELYMYRDNRRVHLPISDLSWMLFYRDSLHKIHAEVITYLPDDSYFRNTAKHKKFSGIVTVSDWQGNFLRGFKYDSNGIRKVISQHETKARKRTSNKLKEPSELINCTATDWYTCVSFDGGTTYDCHYDYTEYECTQAGGGGGNTGGLPTGGDYGDLPPNPIGGGGGGSPSDMPTLEYTESLNIINNLSNGATKDPIEFYLIAKYKSDNILDLAQFEIAGNSIKVGDYYLTPHYDKAGNLVFYAAMRNSDLGIEYIIRADGLQAFKNKIDFYTQAANLFYLNGIPSEGQIAMAAGDYWSGLSSMWSDAVHSPEWWAFVITGFGEAIATLPAETTVGSTLTTSDWEVAMWDLVDDAFQGEVVVNNQIGSSITIDIPNNYVPRIVNTGKGVKFVPKGTPLGSDANAIRIMEPTFPGETSYPHPKGYVVFHNSSGQPFNPETGQTLSSSNWHYDFQ